MFPHSFLDRAARMSQVRLATGRFSRFGAEPVQHFPTELCNWSVEYLVTLWFSCRVLRSFILWSDRFR